MQKKPEATHPKSAPKTSSAEMPPQAFPTGKSSETAPRNKAVPKDNPAPENKATPANNFIVANRSVPENIFVPKNGSVPRIDFSPENNTTPKNNFSQENQSAPGNDLAARLHRLHRLKSGCPTPAQAARELARRSLPHFARLTQPHLSQEGFQLTYYRTLDAFARGHIRRLVVTLPPQHGKSTGSSVLLPAYLLGLNPALRIALASYSLSLAARFNRRVQQLIETPLYGQIFPSTRIKAPGQTNAGAVRSREEFDLLGQPGGLLAVGREGALTGNPVDVLILDDLYKDALEANSPLVRENIWDWYNSVVKTRLHNASQELIVFTRWHEDDLVGRLAGCQRFVPLEDPAQLAALCRDGQPTPDGTPCDRPAAPKTDPVSNPDTTSNPHPDTICGEAGAGSETWFHLHFEALKTTPSTPFDPRHRGEALWPGRQSAALLEQKRRLDPPWFEALYQGRPAGAEGLLYGGQFELYDRLPGVIVKRGNYTDTADTGADYLCSVSYGVGEDGTIYVTGVVYTGEPMEVSEPMVAALLQQNDTRVARIESNNGGRGFARAVARLAPRVRVEWFHQSRNKEARILSNSATVLRRLRMPRDWALRWGRFHDDVVTYRRLYRANTRHDAPDVLTGIVETEAAEPGAKKIRAVKFTTLPQLGGENDES